MPRGPRWLKKREFLAYYLLYRTYQGRCTNLGELVDTLRPLLGGRRAATRMVKMLARLGLLRRCGPLSYEPLDLHEHLDELLLRYLAGRLRRRGLEASYDEEKHLLAIEEAVEDLCRALEPLASVLGAKLECRDGQGYSSSSS